MTLVFQINDTPSEWQHKEIIAIFVGGRAKMQQLEPQGHPPKVEAEAPSC